MIHEILPELEEKYLDLDLNNYILTFDDGLYSQIAFIEKVLLKFPDIEIIYYISTNIINNNVEGSGRSYDKCHIAHEKYFASGDLSNYVTFNDIIKLSKIQNVRLGLHGHDHLNLDKLKQNLSLSDFFIKISKDIQLMLFRYLDWYKLFDNKVLFCPPYNQYHDLYIAHMRKQFALYNKELKVIPNERIAIEKLIK